MKITPISLAVLALLTSSQSAWASKEDKIRHHHLPPHLTKPEQGVLENKALQPLQTVPKLELTKSLAPFQTMAASSGDCTAAGIAGASISNRIANLKNNTDFQCLSSELWGANSSLYQSLFNQDAMIAIANEARQLAISYNGTNSNNLQNFILYLRVGYWAQWGNSDSIGEYTQVLTDATHAFLDTFAANANFYNNDEVHAKTASEVMILMSNFSSHRYLPQAERIIQAYDKSRGYYMQNLMTQALTMLYRGSWNNDYRAVVESNPSILNTLDQFLTNNTDLLGHTREYQYTDAVNELGRFLNYGGLTYERTKPLVKKILDRYSLTGYGSAAWLKAAIQVEYADQANCSYYGTCNFKARLEQQVLPITHSCSDSLTVRAQELTNAQLNQICDTLAEQETYFHQKLETGYTPVADDQNSTLEMIIYNSSSDYQSYSGILFGHSTDNGGIYLEGDPSKAGNTPRFLAYEAEWLRPTFAVWNLEHEYVHYLDGRFNLYGDFATGNAHDTVWWSEGLAEYISKKDRNDGAVAKAPSKTFPLSTLFRTDYNKSANQIYDWGYLATRYMFERQKPNVDSLLVELRAGDYNSYDTILDGYGSNFDQDFSSWLETVQSTDSTDPIDPVDPIDPIDPVDPVEPTDPTGTDLNNGDTVTMTADQGQSQRFTLDIPSGATDLQITMSGGSGEGDLYVKYNQAPTTSDYDHRPWVVGNNEKVEVAQPQQGQWHIMVNPDSAIANVKLTVTWQEPALVNACNNQATSNYGELTSGSPVCVAENSASFYVWVPVGSNKLTIKSAYGDGDSEMLHKAVSWPTTSDYDYRSQTQGTNQEQISISAPTSAWHHIAVKGQNQGMTLQVDID